MYTLRAVASSPARLVLLPLVLALSLTVARLLVSHPYLVEEHMAQMAAARAAALASLPEQQREAIPLEEMQIPPPSPMLTLGLPVILGLVGILAGWAVRAGILHVSSLALGGRQGFGSLYRAGAWASFPLILRDVVQTIYVALSGELVKGPGLSGLLSPPNPTPFASNTLMASTARQTSLAGMLLGRIEVYTLWYLALLFLAVIAACKLPRAKAAIVVAIYALLSVLAGGIGMLARGAVAGF